MDKRLFVKIIRRRFSIGRKPTQSWMMTIPGRAGTTARTLPRRKLPIFRAQPFPIKIHRFHIYPVAEGHRYHRFIVQRLSDWSTSLISHRWITPDDYLRLYMSKTIIYYIRSSLSPEPTKVLVIRGERDHSCLNSFAALSLVFSMVCKQSMSNAYSLSSAPLSLLRVCSRLCRIMCSTK